MIKATADDLSRLYDFYVNVIEHTPNFSKVTRWVKDVYPTREDILGYIQKDSMYYVERDGIIVGALGLLMYQTNDYNTVKWHIDAGQYDVSTVHILAVNPKYSRKGIASKMLDAAIMLSKGKKALRLDTLNTNHPARTLYQKKNFTGCGTQHILTKNAGNAEFYYFEYDLSSLNK